jgi:1,4-dihydroxy-2-naphthoate octaprenyltransferase
MTQLIRVARPQFLITGLALFIFGAIWAVLLGTPFVLTKILFGYLVLLPAHLSISFSNDYFDVDVDKYDEHTYFSGGSDCPDIILAGTWNYVSNYIFISDLVFGFRSSG